MTLTQFCQWDIIIKFVLTFLVPVVFTALATYYAIKKRQAPLAIVTCAGGLSFVNFSALANLSYLGSAREYLVSINKFVTLKATGGKVTIPSFVYQSEEDAFELIKIFDVQEGRLTRSLEETAAMFKAAKIKDPLTDIVLNFGEGMSEIMTGCIFNLFVILAFAIFMYLIKAND